LTFGQVAIWSPIALFMFSPRMAAGLKGPKLSTKPSSIGSRITVLSPMNTSSTCTSSPTLMLLAHGARYGGSCARSSGTSSAKPGLMP
jgi:hypothetical protein